MGDVMNTTALAELREPFEAYLAEIQTVKVETPEEYTLAAESLKTLKGWQKDIEAHFEPARLATYTAYNKVTTEKAFYINKAVAVEGIIKRKMGDFQRIEQLRIAAEQRAAREAEEAARRELAASIPTPEAPVVVSTVIVPQVSAPTRVAGVSVTKTWKYTVTDVNAIKDAFWTLNEALILKVVKDLGRDAEKVVGGIAVEEDVIIGARR